MAAGMTNIAVVGNTTWGTTLGIMLARNDVPVTLLCRNPDDAELMYRDRQNRRFLPGIEMPENLQVTADWEQTIGRSELILFAVPSKTLRQNAQAVSSSISSPVVIMSATKGLDPNTGMRMTAILAEEINPKYVKALAAISGPNLAKEIAQGKPATAVIASEDFSVAEELSNLFRSPIFRAYASHDIIGVELAGAMKNVIALGAGVCDGLNYGINAKSAFINRGLAELMRLGVALGADALTFSGLAGLGDIMATSFSPLSRNRGAGESIASGKAASEVLGDSLNVIEAFETVPACLRLAESAGIDMPITEAVSRILFDGADPEEVARTLMSREGYEEWRGLV